MNKIYVSDYLNHGIKGHANYDDCVKYFSQIRFPLGSRQLPGQRMRLCIYFQ